MREIKEVEAVKEIALFCATMAWGALCAGNAEPVKGSFVQRKVLRDVDVTLTSEGTWSFEKGRSFVWSTLRPLPSVFVATPTNYTFTVGGRTSRHDLKMRIEDVTQIFRIKERKEFVERVDVPRESPLVSSDGIDIPRSLTVLFRNGDRLEIELKL